MPEALSVIQPKPSSAIWVCEFWSGLFAGVDVIKETTVDELPRDDGFLSIVLWQAVFIIVC